MEPEEYQLIDRYLHNELSEAEHKAFENRLTSDDEFAAFVATYREVQQSLQAKADREAGENRLKDTLDDITSEHFKHDKKSAKIISMRAVYWAAAASILLIISSIFIIRQNSTPTYNEYAHYEPLVLASRGDADQLKNSAAHAFNDQEYKQAASYLEELQQLQPNNPQIQIYWALSLIETEQYSKGDSLLQHVGQMESLYAQNARWYLALSYLKQNKIKACQAQLEKIKQGELHYEEALELLDEL